MRTIRHIVGVAFAAVATTLFMACGGSGNNSGDGDSVAVADSAYGDNADAGRNDAATKIVFTPQWTPQSQFAGYYVAREQGFYRDAGLDVEFSHPSASNPAINMLHRGETDIITQQLPQAVKARAEGLDLVNILQTSQRNSLMIVARHNGINSIDDLRGKKVGTWIAGFDELARYIDKEKGLGINWIPTVSYVNLFVSGAVDATLAMSFNEYLQILESGIKPKQVLRLSDLGYDVAEDGLYVSGRYLAGHRDELRAFVEASKKGWEWAAEHPEEATTIVMKYVDAHHIATNEVLQRHSLDAVLELQLEQGESKRSFRLDPIDVKHASEVLQKTGAIKREVTYSEINGAL